MLHGNCGDNRTLPRSSRRFMEAGLRIHCCLRSVDSPSERLSIQNTIKTIASPSSSGTHPVLTMTVLW